MQFFPAGQAIFFRGREERGGGPEDDPFLAPELGPGCGGTGGVACPVPVEDRCILKTSIEFYV